MGGNVTVSVKSILLAGLVLLALVTAYLLGGQRRRGRRPRLRGSETDSDAGSAATEPRRTMRMVASGEATRRTRRDVVLAVGHVQAVRPRRRAGRLERDDAPGARRRSRSRA